jgi:hypothetical protein
LINKIFTSQNKKKEVDETDRLKSYEQSLLNRTIKDNAFFETKLTQRVLDE